MPPERSPRAVAGEEVVSYEVRGSVARILLNRSELRNVQDSRMTYALVAAFQRATDDDAVKVIVLAGAGDHFCAGHDIGTPGRDLQPSFDRKAVIWWDHVDKAGGDQRFARESEVYLGMCRRWREIPKPTVARRYMAPALLAAGCSRGAISSSPPTTPSSPTRSCA